MKITRLETILVKPRWLFLKIRTDAGIVGLGEPITEGRALTCARAVKEIEPYLVGKERATSIPGEACKEGATRAAALGAAAWRGAAAGGQLRRCRSSTMSPHRLGRGPLHLPARRSRQNGPVIL